MKPKVAKRNEQNEENEEKFAKQYVCTVSKFLLKFDEVMRRLFEARG